MKKYIFFDIDGTLRAWPDGSISSKSIQAIAKLKEAGHEVWIATGRGLYSALNMGRYAGIPQVIADGGRTVYADGRLLKDEPLDEGDVASIDEWAATNGIEIGYSNAFAIHTSSAYFVQAYDLDETILVSWKRKLDFRQLGPLYKIYLRLPKGSPIRFPNADRLSHHWTRPDLCIIEATYKERGIDYLVSSRQLSREQLICFGDGDNDVSMFDYCQTSICMGNGTERAKAHASFITLPIEQEGIAYALDQLHYFEGGK